jgi:hypothetical protein
MFLAGVVVAVGVDHGFMRGFAFIVSPRSHCFGSFLVDENVALLHPPLASQGGSAVLVVSCCFLSLRRAALLDILYSRAYIKENSLSN